MKVWIVIPAYNECERLRLLLKELKNLQVSILVVDDGSQDNTFNLSEQYADKVIRNEFNLGKGMALRKAVEYLFMQGIADYIITMDADGQHSPEDLEKFLAEAKKGEYFVIGNRMIKPIGMPKIRIITNKFMSWVISKIVGQKIPDTQCGFRLIKKEAVNKINLTTERFEMESEIIIKAAKRGISIKSIPIRSIYFKHNRSKIHPFIDTLRFLRFIFCLDNNKNQDMPQYLKQSRE